MSIFSSMYKKIANKSYDIWDYYLVSDEAKSRRGFRNAFGVEPDFKDPKSFNEKLLWLKLNYRPDDLWRYVDKYSVRDHIAETIGEQYLTKLLGVWDNADDIDFESLPNRFVIKATHGSGMNLVCTDKKKLDWQWEKTVLNRQLKRDYYRATREWSYKHVKPRLIAEAFLDSGGKPPEDYKILCFNGEPRVLCIDYDRFENHTRAMVDLDWNLFPFEYGFASPKQLPPPPSNLEQMLDLARQLSKPFPFVRVDLYSVAGAIYFGELTFYPGNGVTWFKPKSWDLELGSWLNLC